MKPQYVEKNWKPKSEGLEEVLIEQVLRDC